MKKQMNTIAAIVVFLTIVIAVTSFAIYLHKPLPVKVAECKKGEPAQFVRGAGVFTDCI